MTERWHVYPIYQQGNEYRVWDEHDNFHQDLSPTAMNRRAALMTAAPDMLEALKFVEYWIHDFLPHQGPAENNLLEHVQAAIKKAEGKS
jgi:hypothetical protein